MEMLKLKDQNNQFDGLDNSLQISLRAETSNILIKYKYWCKTSVIMQ